MDFKVFYTEPSLDDLEALLAWSWERHPDETPQFATSLLDHIELLRRFPFMGAPIPAWRGVRRLLHSPFHVYYRVLPEQNRVEILHVWHILRQRPSLS